MISIYKTDFFDIDTFKSIKDFVVDFIDGDKSIEYANSFKRYYSVVFLPENIKEKILSMAKKETGDDSLDVVYSQIVKYQIKDGVVPVLPRHKDEVTGEWVVDIVIDGTVNWPLIIEDKSFDNLPNSVIFIKGEDEFHERPDFPSSSEDDYLLLLFVHLANKDSKYMRVAKEIFGMSEKDRDSFLKAAKPAWGH